MRDSVAGFRRRGQDDGSHNAADVKNAPAFPQNGVNNQSRRKHRFGKYRRIWFLMIGAFCMAISVGLWTQSSISTTGRIHDTVMTVSSSTLWAQPRKKQELALRHKSRNNHNNQSNAKKPTKHLPPQATDKNPNIHSGANSALIGFDPFQSHPPDAIPLFQTHNPAIRKRHQCIQNIRDQQFQELGPLLHSNDKNPKQSVLLVGKC